MDEQIADKTPEQVQAFEDRRWTAGDQAVVWRHRAGLELVSEEPVLDVGGGDGLFLSMLRERHGFERLSMLDISPVAVSKARTKGLEAHLGSVSGDLPFADGAFGTACALDVLEHLYDPILALREMTRVARNVVIVVPNFQYWKDRVRVLCGEVPFSCKPRRGHVYWFNYQVLLDILRAEHLHVDRLVVGAFTRFGPLGPWLAQAHPPLFAHSFALKLRGRASADSAPAEARPSAEPMM